MASAERPAASSTRTCSSAIWPAPTTRTASSGDGEFTLAARFEDVEEKVVGCHRRRQVRKAIVTTRPALGRAPEIVGDESSLLPTRVLGAVAVRGQGARGRALEAQGECFAGKEHGLGRRLLQHRVHRSRARGGRREGEPTAAGKPE